MDLQNWRMWMWNPWDSNIFKLMKCSQGSHTLTRRGQMHGWHVYGAVPRFNADRTDSPKLWMFKWPHWSSPKRRARYGSRSERLLDAKRIGLWGQKKSRKVMKWVRFFHIVLGGTLTLIYWHNIDTILTILTQYWHNIDTILRQYWHISTS